MATRAGLTTYPEPGIMQVTWTGLLQSSLDVGDGSGSPRWSDKTVQAVGTFGAAGAVTLEGSNNGSSWGVLTDEQGVDIVLTGTEIVLIAQNPKYIRPRVTAGDGTTTLGVTIIGRQ